MKLSIVWHFAAQTMWSRLPLQTSTEIDRALIHYAETATGQVRWEPPYRRLRVGAYEAAMVVDRDAGTLVVIAIYRARRG